MKLLAYNNRHQILVNKDIRKALTYSIDRDYIYNNILKKQAFKADGPIMSSSKHHVSGLKNYKFDPKMAIQLLQQQNWFDRNRDGILEKGGSLFRIKITYAKGVLVDEKLVRKIKTDWNKLGIDVIRNPLSRSEIKERLLKRDYDVILMNNQFHDNIESFKKYFQSTSKDNFLGYRSVTTDKYIKLYNEIKPETKKVMFQAIQNQINKDHPAAFLFFLWLDKYFVKQVKFTNYRTKNVKLLPFNEWKFRK